MTTAPVLSRTPALALSRRDWRVLTRDHGTVVLMAFVPVIFLTVFTILTVAISRLSPSSGGFRVAAENEQVVQMLGVGQVTPESVATLLATRFVPILLLIVPMMVAQAIATDSIAGERERGTFESLLLLPMPASRIVAAKVLSGFVPGVLVGWATQFAYLLLVNGIQAASGRPALVGGVGWWLVQLLLLPGFTAAALAGAVLVSAYSKSSRAASQVAGLFVLPVVGAVIGQGVGLVSIGAAAIVIATVVLWGIAAGLICVAGRRLVRGLAV